MSIRHVPAPMPAETEAVARRVIECALRVHSGLGPGFLEGIYQRALCVELALERMPFEIERPVPISYRRAVIGQHRLDLVVGRRVVVEVKSVDRLDIAHQAQVLSYLRASGLRLGLLMNFREPHLRSGIRRVVL